MVNTQIRQFRDSIISIANTSPLPIEIKRLVFAEVYTSITEASDRIISMEKEQALKEAEEKEKKDDE